MTPEDELLVEQVTSAFRRRTADGTIQASPAWHDLDAQGRRAAFGETLKQRALEAAADAQGLSSTAHAVLARIRSR